MKNKYPKGWDRERVERVIAHHERLTDEQAAAEDDAAYEDRNLTVMEVPHALVPKVRALLARHRLAKTG